MELKHIRYENTELLHLLLIVPYGIETRFSRTLVIEIQAFNRTLWN